MGKSTKNAKNQPLRRCLCEEGQNKFYLPPDQHNMNSVFLSIYRGDFAAEIMRKREDLAA